MCEPGKLTQEDLDIINGTMRKSHVLDSYAYMVRQKDSGGRDKFYNGYNHNAASPYNR